MAKALPTALPGISSIIGATNELLRAAALNDQPVLITGEQGTEKSYAARIIHTLSARGDKPLQKINVSWKLPPDLSLYFQHSGGGTLVLNLQKEFPIDMQYTLVEMATDGTFTDPLSGEVIESDVRIILTTSINFDELSKRHPLLPELRDILSAQQIEIPPLRSRTEDIPALTRYAIGRARENGKSSATSVDPQLLALFRQYDWPGNSEDLLLITAQAAITAKGEQVGIDDLPESFLHRFKPEQIETARLVQPNADRANKEKTDTAAMQAAAALSAPTPGGIVKHSNEQEDTAPFAIAEIIQKAALARAARTPLPIGRNTPPPLTTPLPSDQEKAAAGTGELSPRLFQLAKRLSAQATLLRKQIDGPVGTDEQRRMLDEIANNISQDQAIDVLESELDRGLEVVMALRRQMAVLNVRQQQSADTVKELIRRINLDTDGTQKSATPLDPAEAQTLASELREIETIVSRVSSEIPKLNIQLETSLGKSDETQS